MKQETTLEPLLVTSPISTSKGGLWTLSFIIANEAFEKVASYGLMPNMILYLMREYNMSMSTGTYFLFFWSATANFTPFICALLADSYFGRFNMIAFGSLTTLLGMTLLWSTSIFPGARPELLSSPSIPQLLLLCSSFAVMSVGGGGMRSSSLAFGADQIMTDNNNNVDNTLLESYFNWYYLSATSSILISLTCIVYIQDHFGWKVGFGVPVALMFISTLSFLVASPFYVKKPAKPTLFSGFPRVIAASWRNRNLDYSTVLTNFHSTKESSICIPTNKLSFLNKACVAVSLDREPHCTVDQVEEFKSLIKVIPLWSTGIMLCINANQTSFRLMQANSMARHIFGTFEIPSGSLGTFTLISFTLWIALYDRLVLPLASKLTGNPVRLSVTTRMGLGLFLSFTSMLVAAVVEKYRREIGSEHLISVLWLVPQYCLFGLAEAFMIVAQNEFFYSELPRSMASVASTLFGLTMTVGSLFSSVIVSGVESVTSRGGNISWVSSNINEGHYDYYYWVLTALSFLNCLYFIICSRTYGPRQPNQNKRLDDVV